MSKHTALFGNDFQKLIKNRISEIRRQDTTTNYEGMEFDL